MTAAASGDDQQLKAYLKNLGEITGETRDNLYPKKSLKSPLKPADQNKLQTIFDEKFDQILRDGITKLSSPHKNCLIKLEQDLQLDDKRQTHPNCFPATFFEDTVKNIAALISSLEAFRGAWGGEMKYVKNFLNYHPEWKDQPSFHDTTLLYCAARNNHLEIVRFLIEEANCSINAENREYLPSRSTGNRPTIGSTALHAACYYGHIELVKYLTEHGADYFKLNSVGESPLMNANKQKVVCQYFSEFLLIGYTKPDEKLATRSAWEECLKSGPVDDAIWEYQSPTSFQWLQFSKAESDELQQTLNQQTYKNQSFQSTVQLRSADNRYSISFQQFARRGKDRFEQGKINWIRCRASPLKNFALFTHWQLMFSQYPQPTEEKTAYAKINSFGKKISTLKLHSWYQLDSKSNLSIERAMNYRRRFISLHIPFISSQRIFFDLETFAFFTEDHTIEGFLRWIPKLIVDDPKKFQLIDNFTDDEKNGQYRSLTQRYFLDLCRNKILSAEEEAEHDLQSIDFGDQTNTNDEKLFVPTSTKTKTNRWDVISIQCEDLFNVKCDVIVVPVFSKTLKALTIRNAPSGVDKIFYDMEKGDNKDYLNICQLNRAAAKTVFLVNWKGDKDQTKYFQSIEELISKTMTAARDGQFKSIAYPTLKSDLYKASVNDIAYTMIKQMDKELNIASLQVHLCVTPTNKSALVESCAALSRYIKEQEEIANQPISIEFGSGASIFVVKGDLTKQKTDVIAASSSSENLTQILLHAAGKDAADSFNQQQKANPNSLIIVTPPGDLRCKQLFFLKWEPNNNNDDELLKQSIDDLIHNLVQNLLSYNFTSIAFPAIGCGEYGFNLNVLIKALVRSFRYQLIKRRLSWTIHFVIEPQHQQIFDEFSRQILASNQSDATANDYSFPSTWTRTTGGEKRVLLDLRTPECQSIISKFDETMKGKYKSIVRIERIQNERWYMQYLAHKKDFYQRLNKDTETLLFHGCPEDAAHLISEDCFNRSFAGKNGTVYGVGVYFSGNAVYSNSYTKLNGKGERCMFLAQVLVGKTTIGNSSMKVRPVGFDSTTDGKHIIVTYHDAQAYGQYLIFYQ